MQQFYRPTVEIYTVVSISRMKMIFQFLYVKYENWTLHSQYDDSPQSCSNLNYP